MRFTALLVMLAAVASVAVAARGNSDTTRAMARKRDVTISGCTCFGGYYHHTTMWNDVNIWIMYYATKGGANQGWCFQDGELRADHVARISTALTTNTVTPFVNGTWARTYCDINCGPVADCPTATCIAVIADWFDNLITNANIAQCTYPAANYRPTDCYCGFVCTNGYVKCGTSSCINPATQVCVSGVPKPKARRRDVEPQRTLGGYCPDGLQSCPLPHGGYECVNTATDLEACGGCPSYAGVYGNATGPGRDCSALDGVDDVSCIQGSCVVKSCDRDHTLLNGECHYTPRERRSFYARR